MAEDAIFILGGAQTDFARNWTRDNQALIDLIAEASAAALEDARLEAGDIDAVHVGNFAGELFCAQGLLGGFLAHVDPGFEGKPTARHEAACASGSIAVLAAMNGIRAGAHEVVGVLGVEMIRNVPGQRAAEYLGAAAWAGREAAGARYVWPAMFSDLAEAYDDRYGLNAVHLSAISKINFDNAKRNPAAQTRRWTFTEESFSRDDDEANPVIEGWMRKSDCGQVTDGAAMVILAGERAARDWARARAIDLETVPRIKGWGWTTAPILMAAKLAKSRNQGGYMLPWTRKAITDAYARAQIPGPEALDLIETHDCFSITEYMALEHFGLTAPGEGWKAVEAERIAFGGQTPVNPSGGLIGSGHPVGATGVRMVLDASLQTAGRAGDMQVENAKTAATFNVGGSGTANVSFIIGV